MRIRTVVAYVVGASVVFASLCGCGKKEDRATEEPAPVAASDQIASEASSAPNDTGDATEMASPNENALQKQIEEVRAAFLSLRKICEANDVDGYVAFWDDETKREIDGRNLTIDQRRQRRRQRLLEKPGELDEIANATIESVEVNTSQAEKLEELFGRKVEGTMMVVYTDGPALLFHETADGWKLFTKAPADYFRQK